MPVRMSTPTSPDISNGSSLVLGKASPSGTHAVVVVGVADVVVGSVAGVVVAVVVATEVVATVVVSVGSVESPLDVRSLEQATTSASAPAIARSLFMTPACARQQLSERAVRQSGVSCTRGFRAGKAARNPRVVIGPLAPECRSAQTPDHESLPRGLRSSLARPAVGRRGRRGVWGVHRRLRRARK